MVGLVVEGGANRTYYSIGVLDAFLDEGIHPDLFVGVSAGIANGVSFISGQKGRSLELGLKYISDKRYMGAKYFFKKNNKSYYNIDFVFSEIPNKLLPFDYDAMNNYDGEVYGVVTNVDTGKSEYMRVDGNDKNWKVLLASCALPVLFKPVKIGDSYYMDGGCSDPLPVKFAYEKGCDKVIAIVTRERTYTKETENDVLLSSFIYRKKKKFAAALKRRSDLYNKSREFIFEKEKNGSAFVFAPADTNGWKRTEKRPEMLKKMYDEGYADGMIRMKKLKEFIGE